MEYTWSSVSYEASTTTAITVATLVVVVNDATNETSTSTELGATTITEGITGPGATNQAVITYERASGDLVTTTIAYPTPYLDYGAEYTIESGQLSTAGVCQSYDQSHIYNPGQHPALPTPSSDLSTDKADPTGASYILVPVAAPDVPDFSGFYQSAFTSEAGVAGCSAPASSPASASATTAGPTFVGSALTHTSVQFLTATSTSHVSSHSGEPPQSAVKPTSTLPWTGPNMVISHSTFPATPTYVGSVPALVVDGHTVSVGGGRVNVHGTPVRLTVVSTNGAEVTEAVIGYGGGAFGGVVQSSIPITWAPQTAQIGVSNTAFPATPTVVGTVPAIVVDGQTVSLGGGRVNVHGTPVRLTVVTTDGATVTGAVVGYGGGAFGGAVQTTVSLSYPGPQISACGSALDITPTFISTTPVAVVSNVYLSVNGPSSAVCGTPVRITAVPTTQSGKVSTVTEALIGYGGGAFGGQVQSTVPLTWPNGASATQTGKGDLGSYINSGLGGSSPTSSQFDGAAQPAATALSSGSIFGLVVAGVVGMLV